MKTKIAFLFSCLFTAFLSYGQLSAVEYKSKLFDQFKASKTYILMTGNAKYDSELQAAVKDLWKITPYEFIGGKEFDAKVSDKSASFLFLVDIGVGSYGQQYNYLALMNGGKKSLSKYNYTDLIAYCPINHFHNEPSNIDCAYRVRNMIASMLQSMEIVQKNDLKGNSLKIAKQLQEIYNSKAKNISKRTLLICQDNIGDKLSKSDIAGVYPYKFEMCSKEKIEQAIKDKSTAYYYFQACVTMNKSMFVFDPSNGEVVYFDFTVGGLDVKKSHFEDMVDVIKGK